MKILIIFNSKRLLSRLHENLTKKGYEVDSYTIYDLAKKKNQHVADSSYDVIIFNIFKNTPEYYMDICKKVCRENPTVSILAVTSPDGTKFHEKDISGDGLDEFDFDHLSESIQTLLESRYKEAEPTKYIIKDIVLDSISMKAYRAGSEINLTAKEYKLLEYFMRNPNHALTQDQIIDELWDPNTEFSSNVLAVLIKNLRKKIKDRDSQKPIIETMKGIGYRLNM